jgi:hypothetical protein
VAAGVGGEVDGGCVCVAPVDKAGLEEAPVALRTLLAAEQPAASTHTAMIGTAMERTS